MNIRDVCHSTSTNPLVLQFSVKGLVLLSHQVNLSTSQPFQATGIHASLDDSCLHVQIKFIAEMEVEASMLFEDVLQMNQEP